MIIRERFEVAAAHNQCRGGSILCTETHEWLHQAIQVNAMPEWFVQQFIRILRRKASQSRRSRQWVPAGDRIAWMKQLTVGLNISTRITICVVSCTWSLRVTKNHYGYNLQKPTSGNMNPTLFSPAYPATLRRQHDEKNLDSVTCTADPEVSRVRSSGS